jgi:hypothetical protein
LYRWDHTSRRKRGIGTPYVKKYKGPLVAAKDLVRIDFDKAVNGGKNLLPNVLVAKNDSRA